MQSSHEVIDKDIETAVDRGPLASPALKGKVLTGLIHLTVLRVY
jgi:hypothetical protein